MLEIGESAEVHGDPVKQWALTERAPLDEEAHIHVGMLAGGYYVNRTGLGRRNFPDKEAAWTGIKNLMRQHSGTWVADARTRWFWAVGGVRSACRPDATHGPITE
ncbi:MAG TPA: hypothetical protein VFX16_31365 [Pseudonocardiaceae bacterium]|nr:hypothetical protein [Pseudonocardiaceae bacterium]